MLFSLGLEDVFGMDTEKIKAAKKDLIKIKQNYRKQRGVIAIFLTKKLIVHGFSLYKNYCWEQESRMENWRDFVENSCQEEDGADFLEMFCFKSKS